MTGTTGPVIEIEGLRKVYRRRRKKRVALDGLDLVVEPGQVHGFLGPNGSGKTTTLRALLGLVRADAGRMRLFGQDVPKRLPRVLGTVGAVVESPQFFGNFTARRTLRLLATSGGIKRRRVDEVLEIVGLRDRAKERVRSYSLGMKQRLAVASALLKSPRLLILDEPANGLDPAGIRQIRDLLRSLADSGMTVLLSSHILSEVQQICDHVSIISMGRRVRSGPVAEVLSEFDKGDVRVKVADLEAAAKLIGDAGLPIEVHGDHLIVSDLADPAWITETLAKRRMYVSELTPLMPNLENVFLKLTGTDPKPGVRHQVDDAYRPPLGQPDSHLPIMGPATIDIDADPAPGEAAPQHLEAPAAPEAARAELIEPSGVPGKDTWTEATPPKETWPEATPAPATFPEPTAAETKPATEDLPDPTPADPMSSDAGPGAVEPPAEPEFASSGGGATTVESDGALTTPDIPVSPAPSDAPPEAPTSPAAPASTTSPAVKSTTGGDQEGAR